MATKLTGNIVGKPTQDVAAPVRGLERAMSVAIATVVSMIGAEGEDAAYSIAFTAVLGILVVLGLTLAALTQMGTLVMPVRVSMLSPAVMCFSLISDAEIQNDFVAAYCPESATLNDLTTSEQSDRAQRFARQVETDI